MSWPGSVPLVSCQPALGADFSLLGDATPPSLHGDVEGAVPVKSVQGRAVAKGSHITRRSRSPCMNGLAYPKSSTI